MIYDISISEKQFENLKSGIYDFCATVNLDRDLFQDAGFADASTNCFNAPKDCFARINSNSKSNPRLIAEIGCAAIYTSADDLIRGYLFNGGIYNDPNNIVMSIRENLSIEINELFSNNSEVWAGRLIKRYCDDSPIEDIGVFVITEFLYALIMFLRNLPIKKTFFRTKLTCDTENQLFEHIDGITTLLQVLKGEYGYESFLDNTVPALTERMFRINCTALTELGKTYLTKTNLFNINDVRAKLISEIEYGIVEIKNAFAHREYTKIRDIGYDLHNHPEMIMRMFDWRKK